MAANSLSAITAALVRVNLCICWIGKSLVYVCGHDFARFRILYGYKVYYGCICAWDGRFEINFSEYLYPCCSASISSGNLIR